MRQSNLMRMEFLAALGVALEALLLGAWSITVLVSGLTGERVITQDGSETTLGAFIFVVALMLAGISLAVRRGVRWATGPAITLQVLLIGGAVISTDFLSLPIITIIILYAIAESFALIAIRRGQFVDGTEMI